jgi:hypothetical protein
MYPSAHGPTPQPRRDSIAAHGFDECPEQNNRRRQAFWLVNRHQRRSVHCGSPIWYYSSQVISSTLPRGHSWQPQTNQPETGAGWLLAGRCTRVSARWPPSSSQPRQRSDRGRFPPRVACGRSKRGSRAPARHWSGRPPSPSPARLPGRGSGMARRVDLSGDLSFPIGFQA